MDERLVVNVSRFPHETIDGETILIDSETGHVLLLTSFASVLWDHLVGGARSDALARRSRRASASKRLTPPVSSYRSFAQPRS